MTQTKTEKRASSAPTSFVSLDPRDGSQIAEFAIQDLEQVAVEVASARAAATWWTRLGHAGRQRCLKKWRRDLLDRMDELTELVSLETGKPTADAVLEVVLAIDHLHWAGKNASRVLRRRMVQPGMMMSNHLGTVEYHPLGVVGVIGPWNYPVLTPLGSIAYALAAGNVVVYKPSEYTTKVGEWLVTSMIQSLSDEPGFVAPFRLVTGTGITGDALCRSGVDKLAFTGSTATGRKVMAACSESLTPVLMECGGKDAFLVDSDADLEAAADAAVWGAMANAGQTCVGVERVYVMDTVAEAFISIVTRKAQALTVGAEPESDIGPITMPPQIEVIEKHIKDAIACGGQALVGGALSVQRPFVSPVVLVDVPHDAEASQQETFGPVILINRVKSMDEAVMLTNDTDYGLGATVFSKSQGPQIARRLRVGMVGVNSISAYMAMPALPFGGVGQSGFGRIHGADGLREFARPQSVARKMFPAPVNPTSFSRPDWTVEVMSKMAKVLYRW